MYVTDEAGTYYKGTEQHHRRAPFLILMQPDDEDVGKKNNLRGIVRKVALRQCGHWMMGCARVKNRTVFVCGAYGNSGLPKTVSRKTWEQGIPLPQELYDAWNKGGGWNSVGTEWAAMRKRAVKTLLKKKGERE